MEEKLTIREATENWVREFNAINTSMILELMQNSPESWRNITRPAIGDRVYVLGECEVVKMEESLYFPCNQYGTIKEVSDSLEYTVDLEEYTIHAMLHNLERENSGLPMWGTMWSFNDCCDDYWLSEDYNLQQMSECGFIIFEHEEYGYYFGIDGAGYDFYEHHWIPLYKARGLQWHQY